MAEIPVEVSNKHIHLSKEDVEKLFGRGYKLAKMKELSYPGEFAAKETVMLGNVKLRVLGPVRNYSQIELAPTDARQLKINAPLRMSGNVEGAPLAEVRGEKGSAKIPVILAKRHLHCTEKDAKRLGLSEKDSVSVKIESENSATFHSIKVRIEKDGITVLHLNTDEGNSSGVREGQKGTLLIS